MNNYIRESIRLTVGGYIVLIIYCLLSMLNRFNYLDLSYLVVVVICFGIYLKNISEM
jgi:hypothetical protein